MQIFYRVLSSHLALRSKCNYKPYKKITYRPVIFSTHTTSIKKITHRLKSLLLFTLLLPTLGMAADVIFINPEIRAMPPASKNTAAYVSIKNVGNKAVDITSISASDSQNKIIANKVELHTIRKEGDLMQMARVASWAIQPGKTLSLQPGGNHIMLLGVDHAISEGELAFLTINFSDSDSVKIKTQATKKLRSSNSNNLNVAGKTAQIQAGSINELKVNNTWVAQATMKLKNTGKNPLKLTGIDSTFAKIVAIQTNKQLVTNRKSNPLTIRAGKTISFNNKKNQILLNGLDHRLKKGEKIPITLNFSDGDSVLIRVPVLNKTV